MIEKPKTESNKNIQERYYYSHPYDELDMGLKRKFTPRDEVHEIVHGSSKTYEIWNMISLTRENHDMAQSYKISPRKLFIAKLLTGSCKTEDFPENIIIKYNLQRICKNFNRFRKKYLHHVYSI